MGLLIDVFEEPEGGFVAKCHREQFYTKADTLEELHGKLDTAVDALYENTGREKPPLSEIHLLMRTE